MAPTCAASVAVLQPQKALETHRAGVQRLTAVAAAPRSTPIEDEGVALRAQRGRADADLVRLELLAVDLEVEGDALAGSSEVEAVDTLPVKWRSSPRVLKRACSPSESCHTSAPSVEPALNAGVTW